MNARRMVMLICMIAVLGLITAWQQIQSTRWAYRISEADELKKQVLEENKIIEIELAAAQSPKHLLTLAQEKNISLGYQEYVNTARIMIGSEQRPELASRHLEEPVALYGPNR